MYLMKKKYFSSAQLIPISFLAAIIIDWIDKSPAELNLRKSYEVNIVAKQEKKGCKWELIEPTAKLNADCRLLIVLEKSRLGKLK